MHVCLDFALVIQSLPVEDLFHVSLIGNTHGGRHFFNEIERLALPTKIDARSIYLIISSVGHAPYLLVERRRKLYIIKLLNLEIASFGLALYRRMLRMSNRVLLVWRTNLGGIGMMGVALFTPLWKKPQ
jgi:hypothetical protein